MSLSELILNLMEKQRAVDEYFSKHDRNPYLTHPLEDELSVAKQDLDSYMYSILHHTHDFGRER